MKQPIRWLLLTRSLCLHRLYCSRVFSFRCCCIIINLFKDSKQLGSTQNSIEAVIIYSTHLQADTTPFACYYCVYHWYHYSKWVDWILWAPWCFLVSDAKCKDGLITWKTETLLSIPTCFIIQKLRNCCKKYFSLRNRVKTYCALKWHSKNHLAPLRKIRFDWLNTRKKNLSWPVYFRFWFWL